MRHAAAALVWLLVLSSCAGKGPSAPSGAVPSPDRPVSPPTYTLSGTLTERTAHDRRRRAGAEVIVRELDRAFPPTIVVTNDQGGYSVGGISPGRTLAVVGNVDDCAQPAASIVAVTQDSSVDVEIVCSPDITIDAVSPGLRGVVHTPWPARYLLIGFDFGCDGGFEASALVGADGSYQMARLPRGSACLWLGPPKPVRVDLRVDTVVDIDWDALR